MALRKACTSHVFFFRKSEREHSDGEINNTNNVSSLGRVRITPSPDVIQCFGDRLGSRDVMLRLHYGKKKKRPLLLFRCGVASLLSWQLPNVIKVMSCNLNPSTVPSNHFTRVKNMLLVTMWWEMNVIFNQFDSLGISFHIRATNCGYRYRVIGCKMSLNTETVGHNVQNPKRFNVLLHCCKKTSSLEPEKVWHSY